MILKDRVKEELYRSLNVFNEAKNIKNSWIVFDVNGHIELILNLRNELLLGNQWGLIKIRRIRKSKEDALTVLFDSF